MNNNEQVGGLYVNAIPAGATLGLNCECGWEEVELSKSEIRDLIALLERAFWHRWQDENP